MKTLYKRLAVRPRTAAELSAATLLINVLAFADIIFVMLILRRYVAHGFDGTLFLLTFGALAALGLQLACKEARSVLATRVSASGDEALAGRSFRCLVRSRLADLLSLSPRSRELTSLLADSQAGADATVVCAAMDFPFSLVFIAATAVLHPVLGLVVLVGAWMALTTASRARTRGLETATALAEETAANRSLIASAAVCADTVRVFRGGAFYRRVWREQMARLGALRTKASDQRTLVQSSQATVSVFTRVAVYAVGAKLVVDGELTFASLIGGSMLGSYAVAKASMLVSARVAAARAREADHGLAEVLDLPPEPSGGPLARLGLQAAGEGGPQGVGDDADPSQGLSLRGLGFGFPGSKGPLFKDFDLDVAPGTLVVAHGFNGSGKTTLARLVAGLIQPDEGEILAGGVSLAEADADAWRAGLVYMPQEPDFFVATMRENLTMANPGVAEAELNRILRLTGLRSFLDAGEQGLESPMSDAGRGLPLGRAQAHGPGPGHDHGRGAGHPGRAHRGPGRRGRGLGLRGPARVPGVRTHGPGPDGRSGHPARGPRGRGPGRQAHARRDLPARPRGREGAAVNEFLRRLRQRPVLAMKLFGATVAINILGFASPIFVMLILGVYINSGFDSTLYTLSIGMFLAMLLQSAFKEVRTLQAGQVSAAADRQLSDNVFEVLARARSMAVERVSPAVRRQIPGHLESIQAAYSPAMVNAVYDAPFALLFIAATFWFSGTMAVIGLVGVALVLGSGYSSLRANRLRLDQLQRLSGANRVVAASAVDMADTVRAFRAGGFLCRLWDAQAGEMLDVRRALSRLRLRSADLTMTAMTFIRIMVYAVGAKEVVMGRFGVAELIVANILVGRAMRQVAGFAAASTQMMRAGQALGELRGMLRLPMERDRGTALRRYSGRLELRDLSFAHPGSSGPLFESLELRLEPGQAVVIHGPNGSGKTTMARLMAGLTDPLRGEILADGINLRQMAPDWWRRQLVYVPQEPAFLDGTLRQNLSLANPDLDPAALDKLVTACGLERYLASTELGLETEIRAGGRTLPLGVRRRLALVRALATGGRLVVMDEPLEGLDEDGARTVAAILLEMVRAGRTLLVFSHDAHIIKGADYLVDLGAKPIPTVTRPGDAARSGPAPATPAPENT